MTDCECGLEERVKELEEQLEQERRERRSIAVEFDKLHEQFQDLRGDVDAIDAYQKQYVEDHLESGIADDVSEMKTEIEALKGQLESVVGLAEGEESSRKKRAVDLAMDLIRRAEARPEEDAYQMWQNPVKDALASHGHGPRIYNQWAHDAMEDVATATGFGLSTMINKDGREVKAIRVDLTELLATDRETVSNEIITGGREAAADGGLNTDDPPM